ncbi:MAG: rubrerythrin family protein [Ferruginibacter sp.]
MKKLLIIPAVLLLTGCLFITSCSNADNNAAMKAPVQENTASTGKSGEKEANENGLTENEKNSIAKPASYNTGAEAASKTTDNMQAAFKGETTASAKYAAYSKKAAQEGYHEIALLFKAASTAENIHASNHKAVLLESGVTVPAIKPEFTVKTTKENLQDAIAGETYEATTMYPEFLTAASKEGNQIAIISLNYAYKTEKKHKAFYEEALAALQNNTVKALPTVFYVCPTCGNTYQTTAPARCGISMTSGEKFLKITSL